MTPTQLRSYIDRLRRMNDATHNGRLATLPPGSTTRLDQVEERLLKALHRDQTGDPLADGYPTGTLSSGGEDAAQSTTEGAALSRLGPHEHDRHHELTDLALWHLQQAVDHIVTLLGSLEAIDRLAQVPRTDPSGTCQACGRHVEGTANDRLRSGYCLADHRAWLREGRPDRADFERRRRRETAA